MDVLLKRRGTADRSLEGDAPLFGRFCPCPPRRQVLLIGPDTGLNGALG
jgi:hypothetical protein